MEKKTYQTPEVQVFFVKPVKLLNASLSDDLYDPTDPLSDPDLIL